MLLRRLGAGVVTRRLSGRRAAGDAARRTSGRPHERQRDVGATTPVSRPTRSATTASRGRRFAEPPPRHRTEYQRDRDRIVHSTAFRRLVYKTQVFVNHEGDLYRTRLTHSLEVAQIARSVARALGLNEPLAEAICLAHDLGHTPFGHAGQDALNDCMREFGGFEHNLQSLRVVDELEERYAEFPGLNLTFETARASSSTARRPTPASSASSASASSQRQQPGLEAQLANLADEIAYNNHDVDDGIRAGLITIEDLRELPRCSAASTSSCARAIPQLGARRLVHEVVRRMIDYTGQRPHRRVERRRIAGAAPATSTTCARGRQPLLTFSDAVRAEHLELKRYLREHLYRHYRVLRMTTKAQRVVRELFDAMFGEVEPDADRAPGRRAAARGRRRRARPRPRRRRLHRRHDRPLRDPRAPPAVRSRGADLRRAGRTWRLPDAASGR